MSFAPLSSLGTQGPYVIVMYIRDTCSAGAGNHTLSFRVRRWESTLKGEHRPAAGEIFSFRAFLIWGWLSPVHLTLG